MKLTESDIKYLTKKVQSILMENYPDGAAYDPSAPWNEKDDYTPDYTDSDIIEDISENPDEYSIYDYLFYTNKDLLNKSDELADKFTEKNGKYLDEFILDSLTNNLNDKESIVEAIQEIANEHPEVSDVANEIISIIPSYFNFIKEHFIERWNDRDWSDYDDYNGPDTMDDR